MAVNDITRILDFQPQNQPDVALPEPPARREPSEYRKALSRSVSPREDRRSTESSAKDRASESSRSRRAETSRSRDVSDAEQARETASSRKSQTEPEQPVSSSRDNKEDAVAGSDRKSTAESARDIQQSDSPRSSDSDTETTNKPSITTQKAKDAITPPSSLRDLFPSVESDSQIGEKSHRLQTHDEGLHPPQGLALSLQERSKQNEQNDVRSSVGIKSKPGPVPWNEALWNKPSDNGNSQDSEQSTSATDGFIEQLNKPKNGPNVGGEFNAIGDTPGNLETGDAVLDSTAASQEQASELSGTPIDQFAQQSFSQTSISQTETVVTAPPGGQRPEEAAVAKIQAEVGDGRQTPANVKRNDQTDSAQVSNGTPFGQSTGTIGLPNGVLNTVAASGQEQIAPAAVAAASAAEIAPETATVGRSSLPGTVNANSNGMDGLHDSGLKPLTAASQPVVSGSAKSGNASAVLERGGIAEQAADAARGAIETNRPFRVRLNPPELGSLQVEITQRDGVYSARLEVQNSTAQQALLDHIEQLKETLQQNGIRLDRVDVQLNSAGTEDRSSDGSESRQQQHETSQDSREDNQRRRQSGDDRHSRDEVSQDGQRDQAEPSDQVDVQI